MRSSSSLEQMNPEKPEFDRVKDLSSLGEELATLKHVISNVMIMFPIMSTINP